MKEDKSLYCAQCGKPLDDNSRFCAFCGHKVGDRTAPKLAKASSGGKSDGMSGQVMKKGINLSFLTTIGVAVCIVLAVALVFVIRGKSGGGSDEEKLLDVVLDAYSDYYKEYPLEGTVNFALDDYDGDGMPELVIASSNMLFSWLEDKVMRYEKHEDQVIFLAYKNEKVLVYTHDVKSIGEGILDVRYDKKTNRFCIRQQTADGIADYGYENTNTVYHDDF